MKEYSLQEIKSALIKIGLKKGDVVFVNPEIYRLGRFNENYNKNIFEVFLDALKKILGKTGTICTNTYTFNTLRFKETFNHDDTRCTSGGFSSLLLNENKVVRSNHPVFSISAIGKHSNTICKNNSNHNFGYNSPYHRILSLNGKVLNLGMEPWKNPYNHVAEYLIGVPYCYNKLTEVRYLKKKKLKNYKFSTFVRYLDFNLIWNYNKIKKKVINSKIIKKSKLGEGYIYLVNSNKYLELCIDLLTKDQFSLIRKKYYLKKIKKNIFENIS